MVWEASAHLAWKALEAGAEMAGFLVPAARIRERYGLLVFKWLNYFSFLCSTRIQNRVPPTFRDTILLRLNLSRNTILSNSETHSGWQSRLILTVMLGSQGSLSPGLSSHGHWGHWKTDFSDNPVTLGTQTKSRDHKGHGGSRALKCPSQSQLYVAEPGPWISWSSFEPPS